MPARVIPNRPTSPGRISVAPARETLTRMSDGRVLDNQVLLRDGEPPEVKENNLKNRIPLHREGTSEQVASLIREMATNEYVTGETFSIDGGLTMRTC